VKPRYIVAAMLLFFAWKGAVLEMEWPPSPAKVLAPAPPPESLKWATSLRPIASKMTPRDRAYLANFYEAIAFVLLRDGDRPTPIITDTNKFEAFHAGSLDLAIDRKDVGKYDGLGPAIDEVFVAANGADIKTLDADARGKMVAACGVLSWTFTIHGE
jgi:hypothetical protein